MPVGGEAALTLGTGDKERVIQIEISGERRNMEAIVVIEPSKRFEIDVNQRVLYEGHAILHGDETDAIWMIWKYAYDANGNLESKLRASNAYDQAWDSRATLGNWK